MRPYQTLAKLEELVFSLDDTCTDEEINMELSVFFRAMLLRKRDDPFEGGLQASGVILLDKAAMKINEKDGMAPHAHGFETLAQYMDGETMFSGVDTLGKINLRKDDPHSFLTIERKGFIVRILMGKDQLIMAINTSSETVSLFQLRVIEKMINYARSLWEQGYLKDISINYVSKEDRYITDDDSMTEKQFDELKEIIDMRKEERIIR